MGVFRELEGNSGDTPPGEQRSSGGSREAGGPEARFPGGTRRGFLAGVRKALLRLPGSDGRFSGRGFGLKGAEPSSSRVFPGCAGLGIRVDDKVQCAMGRRLAEEETTPTPK